MGSARSKAKKTWRQKLADAKAKPGLPKVFFCDQTKQNMVVPSPAEIERIIRDVPQGRLITFAQIGQRLCRSHHADVACPMTTGIFAWLIANAAEENVGCANPRLAPRSSRCLGAKRGTPGFAHAEGQLHAVEAARVPWWRVLKAGGKLNPKFPGGGATQQSRLEAEGHQVLVKGKNLQVADFERALVQE